MISFLRREQPQALPHLRAELQRPEAARDEGTNTAPDARETWQKLHGRLAGTEPRRRGDAAVSDATGMAGLTAPTGGVPESGRHDATKP